MTSNTTLLSRDAIKTSYQYMHDVEGFMAGHFFTIQVVSKTF